MLLKFIGFLLMWFLCTVALFAVNSFSLPLAIGSLLVCGTLCFLIADRLFREY